jgi:putative peptidoglycan lipid II flippase
MINRILASELVSGSISALDYAEKANNIIFNILISPIIMLIFPRLSSLQDDLNNFCRYITKIIKMLIYLVIPAAVLLFVLRVPVTSILYERGVFTTEDALHTSIALGCLAAGIPGICLYSLLGKIFYSRKNTKTPMVFDIFIALMNILFSSLFVKNWGIGGIAFALSLSSTIGCAILMIILKGEVLLLKFREILIPLAKALIAAAVMVLTLLLFNRWFINNIFASHTLISLLGKISVSAIICGLSYLSALRIMHVKIEVKACLSTI